MNDSYIINEAGWDILKNSTIRENGYIIRNRKLAGVVNNFHFESLHYKVLPMIFFWGKSDQKNIALCKLTNSNNDLTIDYIKDTYRDLAPESLCKYTFLDQSIKQLYSSEEIIVKLLGMLFTPGIIDSQCWNYSLSSISAENRTKEIGIRKINGAKVSEVMAMLSLDFLKWDSSLPL